MADLTARASDTSLLLAVSIIDGLGPVTGGAVTVAIFDSDGDFLDFSDGVFKSSGWTTKTQAMAESSELGCYFFDFDPSPVSWPAVPATYSVRYKITTPVAGLALDSLSLDSFVADAATPADVSASEAVVTAALATLPSAADVWALATAGNQGAGTFGSALTRLFGGNTRTKLFLASGAISTSGREVPNLAVSHMEVDVRDDGGSFPGFVYYVVFNYEAGDSATDAPKSSTVESAAPIDGSFTSTVYPS